MAPRWANPNVVDYRVPRSSDLPPKLDLILAERRDGIGPYGAQVRLARSARSEAARA
jgi:CO/xanthine dehydrogenase Mo-binding subunit